MSSAKLQGRGLVTPIVLLVIGTVVIGLALQHLLPWTGVADQPEIGAHELAELALQNTLYVQGLATAVFGGALLLLGQLPGIRIDPRRELTPLMTGFVCLSLALIAGFVTSEATVEAAVQGLIHTKMESFFWLRVLQVVFLLVGVVLVGWALIWRRLSRVETEDDNA